MSKVDSNIHPEVQALVKKVLSGNCELHDKGLIFLQDKIVALKFDIPVVPV